MIEILLGLALLGLLVGGIFSVQKGAMEVSAEITEREVKTLKVHSFCELLRRNFEQMPGNARVNLLLYGGAGSDLTEVVFSEYPLAFTWPGVSAGAKTVLFRTERASSGFGIQASLLYLDEEQAQYWQQGKFDESKALGRLTLMDGIQILGWQFFDDAKQEWEIEWPTTNTRRPSFIKMTLQFTDGYDPVVLIFWIPTMANPQTFTGGFGGQSGGGQPGGGPPGAGQPGGGPPGGGGGGRGRGNGQGGGGRGNGPRGGGGAGSGLPPLTGGGTGPSPRAR